MRSYLLLEEKKKKGVVRMCAGCVGGVKRDIYLIYSRWDR